MKIKSISFAVAGVIAVASVGNSAEPWPYGTGGHASSKPYGTDIQVSSKDSIKLGVDYNKVSFRFNAISSAKIYSVTWNNLVGTGLSAGDGGDVHISIESDDGSNLHLPSGRVLASATVQGVSSSSPFFTYTFLPGPWLVPGKLYHLVLSNASQNVSENYTSIGLLRSSSNVQAIAGRKDLGVLVQGKSGNWISYSHHIPIFEIKYSSATPDSQGISYHNAWLDAEKDINGTNKVRQSLRDVPYNVVFNTAYVYLKRAGLPSDLKISIQGSGGSALDYAEVTLSKHSMVKDEYSWVKFRFPSDVLIQQGYTFYVELSSADSMGNGVYKIYPIAEYSYDYRGGGTYFWGRAEFYDGIGLPWEGWDYGGFSDRNDADLQFYLTHED